MPLFSYEHYPTPRAHDTIPIPRRGRIGEMVAKWEHSSHRVALVEHDHGGRVRVPEIVVTSPTESMGSEQGDGECWGGLDFGFEDDGRVVEELGESEADAEVSDTQYVSVADSGLAQGMLRVGKPVVMVKQQNGKVGAKGHGRVSPTIDGGLLERTGEPNRLAYVRSREALYTTAGVQSRHEAEACSTTLKQSRTTSTFALVLLITLISYIATSSSSILQAHIATPTYITTLIGTYPERLGAVCIATLAIGQYIVPLVWVLLDLFHAWERRCVGLGVLVAVRGYAGAICAMW